jgi:basic amino acid/polyamine antiporter, APA family
MTSGGAIPAERMRIGEARPAERPGGGALPRVLNLRAAVALGVGGTVGGGVYVLVGAAAREAGPAALAAFAIAFPAALLIALPYAELACRFPLAGGGYAFARAVLGPAWGFLMGWGYWGAYVFVSGYVTLGFGGYLHALAGVPRLAGAVALIVCCLAVALAGMRVSGRVQVAIVATAALGLAAFGAWGLPSASTARWHPFLAHGPTGLGLAALLAFLAFGGFDMVAAAGEEVERPERNLPRAILLTLAAVLGLYLLVCAVALGVMPAEALGASPAPLADAASAFGGAPARGLVTATALVTTAATANAVLLVTSRISFAMARDGMLPRPLARTAGGTPYVALLANAALLGAVALTGSVRIAAAIGGFLYVLHFLGPLVSLVVLRREGGTAPAFTTPCPRLVIPLAFAACAALLAASGPVGIAGGAAWLAAGALGFRTVELAHA